MIDWFERGMDERAEKKVMIYEAKVRAGEVQKAIWMNEEYLAHYQEIYDEAVKNGSENSKWWLDRINMHKQSLQALRQMQTVEQVLNQIRKVAEDCHMTTKEEMWIIAERLDRIVSLQRKKAGE